MSELMIDLHCHLLPGIDDGAQNLDESLELARIAVEDGITHAVMTPHVHPGRYENERASIQQACEALREALGAAGIPLNLSAGGEVRISAEIPILLEQGRLPLLGNENEQRYLLLEFPHNTLIPGAERLFDYLVERSITPIIAHPERNKAVMDRPKLVDAFVSAGCLLQLTAASVAGDFGRPARRCAEQLLKQHSKQIVLATDAHNKRHRPPKLQPGRRAAESLVGESESWDMVNSRPRKIIGL